MEDGDSVFDRVMHSVGDEGKFQKRYNIVFNFVLSTCVTMVYMNLILAMAIPDHWCHVPGRELTNLSLEEWKDLTIPRDVNPFGQNLSSSCSMYVPQNTTWSDITEINRNITECQYGYEYDTTWYSSTVASSQNWVCNKEISISNVLAAAKLGEVLAGFVFGYLGDTIGRRPIFVISLICSFIGRIVSPFVVDWKWLFLAASVLATLPAVTTAQSCLVTIMELSPAEDRAFIMQLQNCGWTTGMCLLPLIYWVSRDWVIYFIASTSPLILYLPLIYFLVESPRWLLSRGRVAECLQQLHYIAKVNGTRLSPESALLLQNTMTKPEKVYGVGSLFANWRLAKNTTLVVVCWMCCILTYNTLVLNVSSMSGNPFLNFFYQSLAELPSFFVARYLSDTMGRRFTGGLGFLLCAVGFIPIVTTMHDESMSWLHTAMIIMAKFAISKAYFASALQAVEIYPTNVRQSGNSLGSLSGNSVSILSPYIVYLGINYDARLPFVVMAILCMTGTLIELFLPETLHEKLPETLQEAGLFGMDQDYFSFPRKKKDLYALANLKVASDRASEAYDSDSQYVQ